MGIHQCPLIVRSSKWLDIRSSIRTSQDVIRYLGTHWHQWWVCLTLVNGIHQWPVIQWFLFMLDIDTFIHMTRIVPLGFVAGEDYTLFHDSLSSYSSMNSDLWEHDSSTFSYFFFCMIHQHQFRFLHFTFSDLAVSVVVVPTVAIKTFVVIEVAVTAVTTVVVIAVIVTADYNIHRYIGYNNLCYGSCSSSRSRSCNSDATVAVTFHMILQ